MSVLITRPDSRGQALVELLNQQQIFAIHQPLFKLGAGADLPQLPLILAGLNAGDYVFAVSKQAVEFASETLAHTGFSFRSDVHYFSVGRQTAAYFSSKSAQPVIYPLHLENSEGVLILPEMKNLEGKQLVILRADAGRELIAETAILRGANVQYVECYCRQEIEGLSEKISVAKRAGINIIVVTSQDILIKLYQNTAESDRVWLLNCHLVAISSRIIDLALEYGWSPELLVMSPRADNQSLCETVVKLMTKVS